MAKKDNTLLWVVALGVGGYLFYEHQKKTAAAATSPAVSDPGNTLNVNSVKPVVMLPPSSQINTNQPVSASAASSAPSTVAINTTGLVPATVQNGQITLQPGQALALDSNSKPIVDASGRPLVFPASAGLTADPASGLPFMNAAYKSYLADAKLMGIGDDGTEVL